MVMKKLSKKESKQRIAEVNYESQCVEFKRTWWDEYLKAISAFANGDGGD